MHPSSLSGLRHRFSGLGLAALFFGFTLRTEAQRSEGRRPVTRPQITRLLSAIRDEIYARGYAPQYLDMPADSIPIYVDPQVEGKYLWVVYKLLPFGELHRAAWLSPDSQLVFLAGDPEDGFPPTHPTAMPTIYMNDDDVINMKKTWKRVWLRIDFKPSLADLATAKGRQAMRDSILGRQ